MKQQFIAAIFSIISFYAQGQNWQGALAQQMGMAFSSSAPQASASGAVANPAGLAKLASPTMQVGTGVLYGILPLQTHTALFAGNGWGIAVAHWGMPFFSRQTLGASAGGLLGNVAWGARLMAYQWTAEQLPTRHRWGMDFGAAVPLTEKTRLGASISQASWGKAQAWALYQLPMVWQIGLEGMAHEKLAWAFSIKQASLETLTWQAGANYRYNDRIQCQIGISSQPYQLYAGAQYAIGSLQMGYAANRHPILGISQSISVQYVFRKKRSGL